MSDLRSLYYKALFDPAPQSINDLAKRYKSLRTAILNDSQKRKNTYHILFNYTKIKTLLQLLQAEKNDHISALDEVFYKLTRGIEILKPPLRPKEYQAKTAVMAEFNKDVVKSLKYKFSTLTLDKKDLLTRYRQAAQRDLCKMILEEWGLPLLAGILCLLVAYYSPWFLLGALLNFIAIFISYDEVWKKRDSKLEEDIDNYNKWRTTFLKYCKESAEYEKKSAEYEARLKEQMLQEQSKPSVEGETAGIDL